MKVLSLVDRSSGAARSYVLSEVNIASIQPIVADNLSREARLMTDEAAFYRKIGKDYASHTTVNHAGGEYVDAWKPERHTNTVEGFFSIFKRGMRGIYQQRQEKHLHRYLAEFDFRYTNRVALGFNDADRADTLLKGVTGKRLTYQTVGGRA